MTPEKVHKLNMLSRQLTQSLMSAALCAREISEIARTLMDVDAGGGPGANGNGRRRNGGKAQQSRRRLEIGSNPPSSKPPP